MLTRLLLTTCLILTSCLAADEPCCEEVCFDRPLSLAELVNIALENHPSTKYAWWNARRAAAAVGIAKSACYPDIKLNLKGTNGRDFRFINGPDDYYTIFGIDVLLSMMLYDFGERTAEIKATCMGLLAANWSANWTLQKVMIRVLENAYAVIHAQEVVQAAETSVKEAEKMLQIAQQLNEAGVTPISDVYTSRASLAQLRMDLYQQQALLDVHKGKLAASIGRPASPCIEVASLGHICMPETKCVTDLLALAWVCRNDLMAKQARLGESFSKFQKARTSCCPKLSFNGRAGANHAIDDETGAAQYEVGLRIDMPLFDGFERCYKNRVAFADTQLTAEELSELQLDISLEVLTQARTLEAAREMLPEAEENLLNAQKAYEGVMDKYKAGKERIAEVSNAHRQLVTARVRSSDVKTRLLVSAANLAYATGTLTPPLETRCTKDP